MENGKVTRLRLPIAIAVATVIPGAPKIAAAQATLREEGVGPGPCMGSIGWVAMYGSLELSVSIRTAFIHNNRLHYMSGCGITADSGSGS